MQQSALVFDEKQANPDEDGYHQPSRQQIEEALFLRSASGPHHRNKRKRPGSTAAPTAIEHRSLHIDIPPPATFPAPLVLAGDELAYDPDYPAQSVQDWSDDEPNKVTKQRRTIYMVAPPSVADEVRFVDGWSRPSQTKSQARVEDDRVQKPKVEDLVDYLRAFYHGMTVKALHVEGLEFIAWEDDGEPKPEKQKPHNPASDAIPPYIGLSTGTEAIRIRCRKTGDLTFPAQLNLNDLLDVASAILPSDAYALCMLVHHDLYEDEQDDFCCGRAYGASRIAVVSTARYNPALDVFEKVAAGPEVCDQRENAWPASHCVPYLTRFSRESKRKNPAVSRNVLGSNSFVECYPQSAIASAVDAFKSLPPPESPARLAVLWFGRVCKTVSHELGHCFGIDHCVYFACVMQGTASVAEDVRQPPYLCPVDLAKVLHATAADIWDRYEALLRYCEKWERVDGMFAAFAAWLRMRLEGRMGGWTT